MPMIARAIQDTGASYGDNLSTDVIIATFFQPKEEFYKSVGINPENKDELLKRHSAADDKHLVSPKLFDDVVSALKGLRDAGLKLGITTQREGDWVQREIESNYLKEFLAFENVLSGGRKPKEEKLKDLIKKFGVAPGELLFVGDLPSDIVAAREVGAKSAAISREESGRARLRAKGPDYFLDSLTDLLSF